jgi:hypothetical protein
MFYKAHNISFYVNSACLQKILFYDESNEKITVHLSFLETCEVSGGKVKEKGSAGYEASTCLVAGYVSEQYWSDRTLEAGTLISAFAHIVDTESTLTEVFSVFFPQL